MRFALTENPVGDRAKEQAVVPEFFKIAVERSERQQTLFQVNDNGSTTAAKEK